jgi:hypothetical protein
MFDLSESGWTESSALIGHTAAVEDNQRSSLESFALVSCGCDRSIKFSGTCTIGLQLSLPYALLECKSDSMEDESEQSVSSADVTVWDFLRRL